MAPIWRHLGESYRGGVVLNGTATPLLINSAAYIKLCSAVGSFPTGILVQNKSDINTEYTSRESLCLRPYLRISRLFLVGSHEFFFYKFYL